MTTTGLTISSTSASTGKTSTSQAASERALVNQIRRLDRRLDGLEVQSQRLSWLRLGTFIGGLLAMVLSYQAGQTGLAWLLLIVTLAGFVTLIVIHGRIRRGIERHQVWKQIKTQHLARLTLDWDALPLTHDATLKPGHPFESDLTLTGPRSLRHLIDTTVSRGGSERLRDWLLQTVPELPTIERRQRLVRELRPLSSFRDRLTLYSTLATRTRKQDAPPHWDGEALLGWIDHHPMPRSMPMSLVILAVLAACNLALFAGWVLDFVPAFWGYTFIAYVGFYLYRINQYGSGFAAAVDLERALRPFGAVAEHLETYPYGDRASLRDLCAPFHASETPPSRHLQRIARYASLLSVERNEVLAPVVNALVPWNMFFHVRLHRAKAAIRADLPTWLDVWYDLEALSALATFADLHADYILPNITTQSAPDAPVFAGTELGHPLLPDAERVTNDFALDHLGRTVIVTGSNMSGKSTFLRTLGINLVLAYAGGPVCAATFQTQLFRPFTCIQVTDSVNDGISYFYAEVRRLRALLEALRADHPLPLFFLIDEIFRGTNNRERLLGSRAYIRTLAQGHGVGLISTHDLELVQLADEVPDITNYHFRETIEDGRMVFDYRLHAGPCPTTNALTIMAMEGLPVPDSTERTF